MSTTARKLEALESACTAAGIRTDGLSDADVRRIAAALADALAADDDYLDFLRAREAAKDRHVRIAIGLED